jgi:hypothetical protein
VVAWAFARLLPLSVATRPVCEFLNVVASPEKLTKTDGCRSPDEGNQPSNPANEDVSVSEQVNKAVGNVKNNGPELLDAV